MMVKYLKAKDGRVNMTKRMTVSEANFQEFISLIQDEVKANGHVDVKFSDKGKKLRSNSQNDKYWAMLKELGDYLGYHDYELHELLTFQNLAETKVVAGRPVTHVRSTTDLDTHEFSDYLEQVRRFAIEYGFRFPSDISQH
jgi:hypothetical protein